MRTTRTLLETIKYTFGDYSNEAKEVKALIDYYNSNNLTEEEKQLINKSL